ncbi:MAG: Acg family FMN-binding oxidoreductase [Actinomycetes bacterium]
MTMTTPDFDAVVDLARLAPSVHNTQPWLFQASDEVLTLRRDADRALAVLDPAARQQTISCGAALYLARLGLRLQGFDAVAEPRPRHEDDTLLARIRAVRGPQATSEEVVLAHAARERHTHREPFDDRPVEDDTIEAMRDAAQEEGAWVRILRDTPEQIPLAVLLAHADDAEMSDEAYQRELATWTHRPAATRDGIPPEAAGTARGRPSSVRLRDFALGDEEPEAGADEADEGPPPAEHPLVVVLGTADDTAADWLVAGQALSALLLRAAVDGVQASPLGQVLDQPWWRRRLGSELGSVGFPQMVLRLGHGRPGPQTPRRPVDEVLR